MSENKQRLEHKILPAVVLQGLTVLPGAIIHFDLNKEKSIAALEQAMTTGGELFLVTGKGKEGTSSLEGGGPSSEEVYPVGTVARVKQITKLPSRVLRVLAEGVGRAHFLGICEETTAYMEARVAEISKEEEEF